MSEGRGCRVRVMVGTSWESSDERVVFVLDLVVGEQREEQDL